GRRVRRADRLGGSPSPAVDASRCRADRRRRRGRPAAGRVQPETAIALVGHRLEDLVARAYAEVGIGSPAASSDGQVYLAAPYVSALAGVLAAIEIYKISLGLAGVDRRVDLDLAGVPQGYLR